MNTLHKNSSSSIAILLVVSVLVWATGFPWLIQYAHAALLTTVSDVITDSDLSANADHTITFTTPTGITNGQTITVTFPSGFVLTGVDNTEVDLYDDGVSEGTPAADCTGTDAISAAVSSQVLTFTYCAGDGGSAAAASVMRIRIGLIADGAGTDQIDNPSSAGSQVITLGGTMADTGSLRVAIIDDVVVTASVDTTLTFVITGIASGQTNANGESGTTDITTTATSIPWATLAPGTAKRARQDLAVTTNARNGFLVTLWQDQNLLSGTGADIDIFKDGTDGAPATWTAPLGTLDTENTYGHEGITSEDSTISGSDPFGTALYDAIGLLATPISVFSHTGPADGTTADKGATRIGFKIEINALQEAGTDYTQSITYIATPTF